jgi:NAD+-dependent secondary alcohol dehydrogenase Adh1
VAARSAPVLAAGLHRCAGPTDRALSLDETAGLVPDVAVAGDGGDLHGSSRALVNCECSFRSTLVGTCPERRELMPLAGCGEADLRTSRYDLDERNTVAERPEHGEIAGRAVLVPRV